MANLYHIFGLNVASVIPLPACTVLHLPPGIIPDVTIEFGETPSALTGPRFKGVRFEAAPEEFLLRVDGVARYHVQNGRRIVITPEPGAPVDDILVFLMSSVMGALLHERSTLALHAGAVVVKGGSVIFAGPSGVGKSTLAAGFHRRGYPFLSDDLCAITTENGHPAVLPGFRRMKLWADVLRAMKTDKDAVERVRWGKELEKYFVVVEDIRETRVPVKSIFILETTNSERMEITALKGGEKVDPILENTYRHRFLEGLGGKEDHFRQCAAVAAGAAVYRTVRPTRGFLLKELMDLVEERFLS